MGLEGALYGLVASAAYGFSSLCAAIVSRRVGSRRTTGVVVPVTALILVTVFLLTGAHLPADLSVLLGSVVTGLFASVGYFTAYTALRAGPVTIVEPILSATGGATVVLAMLFLHEQPTAIDLVATLGATVGVILAGVTFGGSRRVQLASPGVAYALIFLVVISANAIVASLVVRQAGWLPALTASRLVNTLVVVLVLAFLAERGRRLVRGPRGATDLDPTSLPLAQAGARWIGLLLVVGVLEVIGVSAFFAGLGIGPTWLVALTSSFGVIVVIAGGVGLFHERPKPHQWLGVVFVFASSLLLAVG